MAQKESVVPSSRASPIVSVRYGSSSEHLLLCHFFPGIFFFLAIVARRIFILCVFCNQILHVRLCF
ncbi:hypothetical protein E5Q_01970 [Mixia osmundae IAM 14324]|uniref:Uncharacterized protein n=1 Tax=Mixia osmundae (strain CBS 9802 / IAM 14324 / JCM 22182 / KY 12970) TaxID=764103 RepID=G7DXK3_MIXOS|nr:hypothetical protein E5Q_01970 [Mixia osmundae IAM 14324]